MDLCFFIDSFLSFYTCEAPPKGRGRTAQWFGRVASVVAAMPAVVGAAVPGALVKDHKYMFCNMCKSTYGKTSQDNTWL
jgi:hypothetical protein